MLYCSINSCSSNTAAIMLRMNCRKMRILLLMLAPGQTEEHADCTGDGQVLYNYTDILQLFMSCLLQCKVMNNAEHKRAMMCDDVCQVLIILSQRYHYTTVRYHMF